MPSQREDSYSNYAESGDELVGLSPSASPATVRRGVGRTGGGDGGGGGNVGGGYGVDGDGGGDGRDGGNDDDEAENDPGYLKSRPVCSGTVVCNFGPTADTRDRMADAHAVDDDDEVVPPLTDDDVALHAPCLVRWEKEVFLPYDAEPQAEFYAMDPLPTGAVFQIDRDGISGVGGVGEKELSVPPGELLLPLLGADFARRSDREEVSSLCAYIRLYESLCPYFCCP